MTIVKWQPFRGLREGDPFAQIPPLRQEMDRPFSQYLRRIGREEEALAPGVWAPLGDI